MQIGLLVFGLAGLLALVSFMPPLAGRLRLPHSVLLAIVGFILGVIIHVHDWAPGALGIFLDSLRHFEISSETFLYVFLPVLLFEAALAMNVRRLLNDISPILVMAIVAVVVCTLVVGYSLAAVSSYGLVVCLLLGAIVATTDPVAVIGLFREVGAPRRLTTLVEGESLFNDAASIALYSVLLSVMFGLSAPTLEHVFNNFLISFLGGGLIGFVIARLVMISFRWLRGWPAAEVTLTVALAYATYFVAEYYLDVSGVVATVIAGIVVGSNGRTRMSPNTFEQLEGAWSQFGFWANSLIFLFAAMLIPRMMAEITVFEVFLILVLYVAAHIARAIIIFGLLPILGYLRLSTKVEKSYKVVMLVGGLRGAISLALALAVTEKTGLSHESRQFIAVSATGFVLMTMFINGLSLRPLIKKLGLNELNIIDRTLRDQAQTVELESLRDRMDKIAEKEHVSKTVVDKLHSVFDNNLNQAKNHALHNLNQDQKVVVGLGILAGREENMLFEALKDQVLDWRTAEYLFAKSERLVDYIRSSGMDGFQSAVDEELKYSSGLKIAIYLHNLTGMQFWLAHSLSKRFNLLMFKWGISRRLIPFAQSDVQPLLGSEATEIIIGAHKQRVEALENALQALVLQYPAYAEHLQLAYLARIARSLERLRYRDMLSANLISGETYADLLHQVNDRWNMLDNKLPLDITLSAEDLIKSVSIFEGLDETTIKAISKVLKPHIAVPGQKIHTTVRRGRAMYFVASGAIILDLPDGTTAELGSGQIFGEIALVTHTEFNATARSLGYSRLLMLLEKDFNGLLKEHSVLHEHIQKIAAQRMRAVEVWQEFQSGKRSYEPLPDANDVVDKLT